MLDNNMMFVAASVAIFVTMALALARALMGPTIYDRIAAINMFGTKTVLLIAVLAFLSGRMDVLLDIAVVYALINFIGVVAVMKLKVTGNFHSSENENSQSVKENELR